MRDQRFHCRQQPEYKRQHARCTGQSLRVGTGNNQLFMHSRESAQSFSIFFQTTGKTLVSESNSGNQPFSTGELCQCLPLFQRRVDTGWVMAAAMEQHYVASLSFVQAVNQRIEVKSVIFRIIIAYSRTSRPAELKTLLWFSQLGLLTHTR